jgi:predicted nucleic acid-binding protein
VVTLDTNILIYSVDKAAGERHLTAARLVERAILESRCFLTLQSLCEFFNVATRKAGIQPEAAAAHVEDWRTAVMVEPAEPSDLADAMRVVREHRLPFWDAMLWATARRAGARYLISEDFQDGLVIEGVRIVNPFAVGNQAVIEAALTG